MDSVQRHDDAGIDRLWERMRSEERAEQLSRVVQDTVRDARVAAALEGSDDQLCSHA